MNKRLLYPLIALVVINLLIAAFNFANAEPFDRYNKPIDIQWWSSACRAHYVLEPDTKKQYAAGICDCVTQAHLNQLNEWCAPDGETWGEVKTYIGEMAGKARFEPLSDRNIGEYMASVINLRWPYELLISGYLGGWLFSYAALLSSRVLVPSASSIEINPTA